MEKCNICGKEAELIDMTLLCDGCLGEVSSDSSNGLASGRDGGKCGTSNVGVAPPKPKPLCGRIIREGTIGTCPKCGSTEKRKWIIGKKLGCIQPECENYYKLGGGI